MTVRRLLPLLLLLGAPSLSAQSARLAGEWSGRIFAPGTVLDVDLSIQRDESGFSGTIDIPAQGARGLKLIDFRSSGDSALFGIEDVPGEPTFHGLVAGNAIVGVLEQGGETMRFTLSRTVNTTEVVGRLRDELRRILAQSKMPGMSVAIVRRGRVVMSEGFGLRDVAASLPVTDTTGFPIGSCTKAFTATLVGTLVDEGRLEWDTPVRTWLPDFRMYDSYATEQITPRDLLSHTSGLPRYDLLWYVDTALTREQLYGRLRWLEPTTQLRQGWQYQNLMVMTAGILAGRVLNTSWESAIRARILDPLRMTRTTLSIDAMRARGDAATGYALDGENLLALPYFTSTSVGPAGTINSCARDMARWLLMNLSDGELEGRRIVSAGTLREIQRPQVVIDDGGVSENREQLFDLYALGWGVHAWRGHRLVEHGGNIDGFSAQVALLPDDEIGIAVLSNGDGTSLPSVVVTTVIDRLLGYTDRDWGAEMADRLQLAEQQRVQIEKETEGEEERVEGTWPSHRPEAYAGFYEHPAFGTVEIARDGRRLRLRYGRIDAPLEHFHYDVYRTRVKGPEGEIFDNIKLNFRSNLTGRIEGFDVILEAETGPSFFERRPPPAMYDSLQIVRYTGRYRLAGQVITVRRVGARLVVVAPGQPEYTLDPVDADLFELRDMEGYQVRFEMNDDRVTSLTFIQPNGNFTAKRVE